MSSNKVPVDIVSVANCAPPPVRGLSYDRDGNEPGLMNLKLGDYHVHDVEISAAFDVDAAKVGRGMFVGDRGAKIVRVNEVVPT
jgi:myo-inositol-1-phosphate synthase